MQVHFIHRNVRDTVVILEEGNTPHPRSPRRNMLVPWSDLNRSHLDTAQCARGEERKIRRLAEEELWDISGRDFQAYDTPLENVTAFKYLGRAMTEGYDNWTEVADNLKKARKSWGLMLRIFIREGADPKVSGHFFKAVVQVVLLFGEETWVLTLSMERALSSFQHRVVQRITGSMTRRRGDGSW